jgi:phosphate/sulfate permease
MDLGGIIPPVPTPFSGEQVDLDRFRENLRQWMAWEGMSLPEGPGLFRLAGVLVAGSNGEAPLLTEAEAEGLVAAARKIVPPDRLLLMLAVSWLFVRATPSRVDRWFRRMQLVSASLYSLGHGGNDAQKTIGIIWMLLIAAGYLGTQDPVPMWVVVACYVTIALGTAFGGWRIVKTMGQRITKLKPVGGFCAETGGAAMLFIATGFGIPVSTTHTITGAIVGAGSAQTTSAVRWGVAGNIVWAWVLTIPCSAFMAGIAWWIGRQLF